MSARPFFTPVVRRNPVGKHPMNAQQKTGYIAALAELERALATVQRNAIITQIGINHVVSMNQLAKNLDETLRATRAQRAPKPRPPQPAVRDTSPMRPKFTGD